MERAGRSRRAFYSLGDQVRDLMRHGRSEPLLNGEPEGIRTTDLDDRDQRDCPDPKNDLKDPSRFGKMFDLELFRPEPASLGALGSSMRELVVTDTWALASQIPVGFRHLGQFIDDGITFDSTLGSPQIDDPLDLEQTLTPNLDLAAFTATALTTTTKVVRGSPASIPLSPSNDSSCRSWAAEGASNARDR